LILQGLGIQYFYVTRQLHDGWHNTTYKNYTKVQTPLFY